MSNLDTLKYNNQSSRVGDWGNVDLGPKLQPSAGGPTKSPPYIKPPSYPRPNFDQNNWDMPNFGNMPSGRPVQGTNRMGQYTPPNSQRLQSDWNAHKNDYLKPSALAYPQNGGNQQSDWNAHKNDYLKPSALNYSPTGSNQQSYTSGSYGQYNPTQQQKQNIASGTWDLYKNAQDGGWMSQAGNPFEIRGVDRGDDPNDYVDFYWRRAGDTGEGQQYGTLSGLAWNDNQNHPEWQTNEANNFWSSASPQFGNFWGQQLGWNKGGTPADQPPVAPPAGIYPDQGGTGTGDGGYRVPGPGPGGAYTPDQIISIGAGGAVDAYKNFLNAPQYYPGWWGDDYQRMDTAKWQNAYPEFLDVPQYQGITMPGAYNPIDISQYPRYEKMDAVENYTPTDLSEYPNYQKLNPMGDYTPISQSEYPEFQKINFDTTYQGIDPSQYQDYNRVDSLKDYQGLMGKDYDRLETALRTPGEIAAQRAFQQGGNYLKDVMGAGGMYGSSVMADQANNVLNQGYMDTLSGNAANAVAQRYGLEQGDLQFGANYDLGRAAQDISQSQFESQLNMNQLAQQLQDRQFGATFGQNQDLARMNQNQFASQFGLNKLAQQIQDSQFGANYGLQNQAQQIQQNQFGSQFDFNKLAQQMQDSQFGANFGLQNNAQQIQQNQFGSTFLQNQLQQQIQDNQFGASYGLQNADLQQQDLMNKYNASMTNRNLLNDYNNNRFMFDYGIGEAGRQENNNLLQNRFQYDLAAQNWRNNLYNQYMNAGLALAGQGAPLQVNNWNYQMQQQNQNANNWGMGIDLVSRLLPQGTSWGDMLSSGWKQITGG